MEQVRNFIDLVGQGNNSAAKDALDELLSARAFEALDGRKTELAQNLFGSAEMQEEELNLEDYSLEELQEFVETEEYEQLDEVSKKLLRSYLKGVKREDDPRIHGDSAGPANQMSDKARSLGRTEQDKEDSRYEGQKLAKRKLGAPGSIPSKVMATEESEQLDELSKSTLGSYVNKASRDAATSKGATANWAHTSTKAKNPRVKAAAEKYSDEEESRYKKRLSGVGKAVTRLTK